MILFVETRFIASPKTKNARLVFQSGIYYWDCLWQEIFQKSSKMILFDFLLISLRSKFLIFLFFQEEDKENQTQHSDSCANAVAHGAG